MNPKKIEFRKRTRTQSHLIEKTVGVIAIVALIVLVGVLVIETSWKEMVFSGVNNGYNSITGAAVEESSIAGEGIATPEESSGELGIQADANSTSCGTVQGSLTLEANVSTTTNCFTINSSNIIIDCAGFTVSGDGGSADSGILNSGGYDNITITNCTFDNFNNGIYSYNNAYSHTIQYNTLTNLTYGVLFGKAFEGTANGTIWNNTFSLPKSGTSYAISAANSNNIFNNTFTGDYSVGGINVDDSNQIWGNYFWGSDGTYDYGNSSLCVNGIGNFYNGSVDVAQVPAADCGPTPNQTVYVNQSLTAHSFSWGGSGATYVDLRTAAYNTWNGTNNIIYLLENHSTNYSQPVSGQGTSAVHFVRSNVGVNCLGYTFTDLKADSTINAFSTHAFNDITIQNCTISNFDNGVSIYGSQRTIVINNTFAPGTDALENNGIYFSNGDNSTITNNTFTGDLLLHGISVGSDSTNNNISQNVFWGGDGIDDDGNNNLCVNSIGNFYNGSVAAAAGGALSDQIPAHDCGPTPNGTIYVNQSAGNVSFTWNGSSATYPDLRTAVYNTWNGTNNTVYMLENHNTSYSQSSSAVHFVRNNVDVNCLGYTYSDPTANSGIYGFTTNGYNSISIHNCTISNFEFGLLLSSGTNHLIYNNSFIAEGEMYGIYFSDADSSVIINNTFSGDYVSAIYLVSTSSANNNISQNQFWGSDGISNYGTNTSICVNGIGNFYNGSVAVAYVYPTDCGPTPFGAVYVNQSATTSFTWNGSSATYPDLRTAVYNTWNGANNTVYFLGNHSTSYSQSSRAVHFVRNNITVNCGGYTYSDPTASSTVSGFDTNGFNETVITNCTISDFDEGIIVNNGDRLIIMNNLFEAGGENEGIYFYDGDFANITNNTFTGDYANFAIDSDNSGPNNTNIWQNQFLGNEGIGTPIGANDYFCVNGIGNYYNSTVAIAQVPPADCGPTPNSNVSTNSSFSTSSWSFSTSTTAAPIYKNLQEAFYNLQENRTLFLAENYQTSSTTQTIRNGTTLDCLGQRINSTADALNINGEVGVTVTNCTITTTGNGIEGITLTSSATGNNIVNTRINTTGTTAYGVTFTSSNGNNIINSTFNIPSANDVYSSSANNNSIINSVFNRSDLGFTGTNPWITVKWYVDVNVTNGTAPLPNATVTIANSTPTTIFTGLTDVNGQIVTQTLTEFWKNSTLTVYETPHNVSGNKTGYATNFTLVNLTQTNSTTVVLNLTNILYPDLKINDTDLVYPAGTIKQNDLIAVNVTVYNLGNTNATDANISFYVDTVLNQSTLINLSNGTSQLVQFNWTALGGNHTLEAKADPANLIAESNESNNNATANISVKYVAVLQYLSPTGSFPRGKDVAGEDALFEVDNTLTALAQVYDLYNSSHALSANCSFYFNETLLGTNLTNSSGYCSYTFDKTNYSYGTYNLTVNFTGLQSDAVSHTSQIQNTTPIGILVLSLSLAAVNHYDGLNYLVGEMAVLNISITQNDTLYSPDVVTPIIRGATDPADGPSVYDSTLYNDSTGKYHYASLITSPPNGNAVRWRVRINSTSLGLIGTASHSDVTTNSNDGNLSLGIINSTQSSIASRLTIKDAAAYVLNQTLNSVLANFPIRKNKNHTLEFIASSGEAVILHDVNLNQTNNNLTLQVVSNYNGTLPSTLKNLTSITALESFPYNLTLGNITLPKNGKVVTSIAKCTGWNSTTATCAGNWSTHTTTFAENTTHLWFNITSFSGYAGGVPYSSNLTIWDQGDAGMPFGGQSTPPNQQLQFYANYTNSTSGAVITGAFCNISFSAAPTGPFNMSYNSSASIYQYNRTFGSGGTYAWNVSCSNATYDALTTNDTIVVTSDSSPNVTLISPAAGYSSEAWLLTNVTFSCNATDDYQLRNISLYRTNSTNQSFALNQSTNISGIANSSSWTLELGRGNYTWNCLAYDNASQQGWGTANRSISLLLDTTLPYFNPPPTSQTVELGTAFGYDVNASDNIEVDTFAVNDTNFTINRSGYITNASSLVVRTYSLNISVNDTSGNVNSTLMNVTVRDTTLPTFTTLTNPTITYGETLSAQFNATDLSGISTWWINDTTRFTINRTTGLLTNNVTLEVGAYSVNLSVNDTYGNINSTVITVTVNAPSPPPPSSSSGGGPSCTSSWNCTEWSKCSLSLKQIRICADQNGCEEDYTEEQDCAKCQEAWVCSAWSECKNNLQTRICTDYNDCGTIEQRPEQVKSCGEEEYGPTPKQEEEVLPEPIGPLIGKAFVSAAALKIAWERYAYYLLGLFLFTLLIILLLVLIKRRSSEEKNPALEELKKWIGEEKQRGLSDSQIMTILLQHTTWSKEEIARAFYEARQQQSKPKRQTVTKIRLY